jgi:3-hydroxy-D-aspartate aldolase
LTFRKRASDEPDQLAVPAAPSAAKSGSSPAICDPTVNLYDWYVCVRRGRVEALWPITARGALN